MFRNIILILAFHTPIYWSDTIFLTYDDSSGLFYGPLDVGNPSNNLSVVFSTMESSIFLYSYSCEECGNHGSYKEDQSSSYEDLNMNFVYSGMAGSVGKEVFFVDTMTLKNVRFGLVQSIDNEQLYSDGIVGLGFNSSLITYPSFIDTITATYSTNPMFSLYLSTFSKLPRITFGGYDSSLVRKNEFWRSIQLVENYRNWTVDLYSVYMSSDISYSVEDSASAASWCDSNK